MCSRRGQNTTYDVIPGIASSLVTLQARCVVILGAFRIARLGLNDPVMVGILITFVPILSVKIIITSCYVLQQGFPLVHHVAIDEDMQGTALLVERCMDVTPSAILRATHAQKAEPMTLRRSKILRRKLPANYDVRHEALIELYIGSVLIQTSLAEN